MKNKRARLKNQLKSIKMTIFSMFDFIIYFVVLIRRNLLLIRNKGSKWKINVRV